MPNILHDKVFDFCESYRASHPGFLYWLRGQNTPKELQKGLWFHGSEIKAIVGLYDYQGSNKNSRSISLVFWENGDNIGCSIENDFGYKQENEGLVFYKEMRGMVGGFKKKSDFFYSCILSEDNGFQAAQIFLENIKNKLDKLLINKNLERYFITKSEFDEKFQMIHEIKGKIKSSIKIKYLLVNISWNSNDWKGVSEDKSGHKWVSKGNTPHESWNFDFENSRNSQELVRGYCQFTKPPKVYGNDNLIIFYSQNQIVGFYGKAEVLTEIVHINKSESYNIVGARPLCILLKNKITLVKEKGYLEELQRIGQIGFSYLKEDDNINAIINEAILLNPDDEDKLNSLANWLQLGQLPATKYWVFQANPTKVYRIIDALKDGLLQSWMVNQYKKEIQIGDKVILWVSGEAAGIYALATVTSPVHTALVEEEEHQYFIDQSKIEEGTRVNLRMDYNLVDKPILKEQVLATPQLLDLKQGTQGTNFQATKLQYDTILNIIHMDTNLQNPLNQILFGPPGTGKTYHTITESVKIVDPEYFKQHAANRNKLQDRFNDLLIKDWEKTEGQISFCTFHQSFSYEDFVEGIKPLKPEKGDTSIKYDVINGIFKKICRLADASNNAQQLAKENLVSLTQEEFNKAVFYKISLGDSTKEEDKEIYDYCISNNLISIGFGVSTDFTGKDESQVNEIVTQEKLDPYTAQAMNYFKNYLKVGNYIVVSYGNSYIRALGKVTGDYEYKPDAEIRYKHFRKVDWVFKNVEIPVTEFYQKNLSQQTIYKLKSEYIIPEFFVRQSKPVDSSVQQKKFVLVIDEINRGNVSSIFGELITLVEPSKRSGSPEALEVVLPYSKERFTVPSNVYIIGTMNTADRSVEALDTALRRRFSFIELQSDENHKDINTKVSISGEEFNFTEVLKIINNRIEKLIGRDHKIGHSYFLNEKKDWQWTDYLRVFKNNIIPLLQEYFFGDYSKMQLVLGSGFIKKVTLDNQTESNFFAKPDEQHDDHDEYVKKVTWEFVKINDELAFKDALIKLLNK